jgi:hypothetical protein
VELYLETDPSGLTTDKNAHLLELAVWNKSPGKIFAVFWPIRVGPWHEPREVIISSSKMESGKESWFPFTEISPSKLDCSKPKWK